MSNTTTLVPPLDVQTPRGDVVPPAIEVISNVGGGSKSSSTAKEGSTDYLGGQEAIASIRAALTAQYLEAPVAPRSLKGRRMAAFNEAVGQASSWRDRLEDRPLSDGAPAMVAPTPAPAVSAAG